jgi:hypothetical protein
MSASYPVPRIAGTFEIPNQPPFSYSLPDATTQPSTPFPSEASALLSLLAQINAAKEISNQYLTGIIGQVRKEAGKNNAGETAMEESGTANNEEEKGEISKKAKVEQ